MYLLGIDVETTGLDPEKDKIIEIGAVVWDCGEQKPITMMSRLIQIDEEITPEITKITGIENNDLKKFGINLSSALAELRYMADLCKYCVAHKALFDKSFILQAYKSLRIVTHGFTGKEWLCSLNDIPYPEHIKVRNLGHLAADHGFLNPFPHRALTDVLTMLRVLSNYDIDAVIERSKSPLIQLVAQVDYDNRQKASSVKFYWNGQVKEWRREIKECDYVKITKNFDFKFFTRKLDL